MAKNQNTIPLCFHMVIKFLCHFVTFLSGSDVAFTLHRCIRYSCVYSLCMSSTLSGSSALQRVKLGDAPEICDEIIFNFYPGLPHIYTANDKLFCQMTATCRLSSFKVYGIVHDHVMKMLYSEEVDLQMKVCPICRHTMLQCMCPELEHSMKQQFVYTFRTPLLNCNWGEPEQAPHQWDCIARRMCMSACGHIP